MSIVIAEFTSQPETPMRIRDLKGWSIDQLETEERRLKALQGQRSLTEAEQHQLTNVQIVLRQRVVSA